MEENAEPAASREAKQNLRVPAAFVRRHTITAACPPRACAVGWVAAHVVVYCLIRFLSVLTLILPNCCIVISVSNLK